MTNYKYSLKSKNILLTFNINVLLFLNEIILAQTNHHSWKNTIEREEEKKKQQQINLKEKIYFYTRIKTTDKLNMFSVTFEPCSHQNYDQTRK